MASKTSILVTKPDYDPMTRYLAAWANIFVGDVSAKGHNVNQLKETGVTEDKFASMLVKNKPDIVFINGHGREDMVAGHDHKKLLDTKNVSVLSGTKVYCVACKSARVLGRVAVQKGADAYIGYLQDFVLVSQHRYMGKPTKDKTAALFLNPSNQVVHSLVNGHSVDQAVKKGKAAFTKSIREALNSDVQSDDYKYVQYLVWNRRWLTSC